MRKYLICLAVCLFSSVGVSQSMPPPPRLVVMLAIDQMRFDYLTRFESLYKGGLRTLLDRGAVFTNANYRHAATETGPGHSVLLSGRHPSHSGIVANEWYDAYLHKAVNVVDDPVQTPIGGAGRAASPANALSFTVGDVLKAKSPQSRVVGVSIKDRSAILTAGRRADAAYWFENDGGNFITSSFYMNAAPAWLTEWNGRRVPDKFGGQPWMRLLDDVSVYDRYAGVDAVAGERDGQDTTFPHVFRARPPQAQYYGELRGTPFADAVTFEFAIEAMKQHGLGRDAVTDILTIGFSGTDGVGHAYGADSHEIMDQMLRLDLLLDRLFTAIEALLSTGVVERVYTHDDLRTTKPSSDPFLTLFQNAFYEPRSPHLTLLLKRDVNLSANVGGTGHGSPYEFDRHVPVVFMGPAVVPGRYPNPSGPEDIAPTLGRVLGIDFPREWDARLLSEMFSSAAAAGMR